MTEAEEEKDKAKDKEERLLEECEKLNSQVDDLEDQLRSVCTLRKQIDGWGDVSNFCRKVQPQDLYYPLSPFN